jgi:choline oxidase
MTQSNATREFDYVVVGGGTAGCIVAARLAEDPAVSVCLIEAGPAEEDNPTVEHAGEWSELIGSELDWKYPINPGRGNPKMFQSRARMVGGCSSHNSVIFWRAHDTDLEEWESLGAEGWGPAGTRLYFDRVLEKVHVETAPTVNECAQAFEQSALAAGFPAVEVNGEDFNRGYGWLDLNVRGDIRESSARAYLYPLDALPQNLTLLTNTQVHGILLASGPQAVGVTTADGEIRATREVILCAGVYENPKLLLLSGIGPAPQLRDFVIPVRADLPGVGEHLIDHLESVVGWQSRRPVPDTGIQNCENAVWDDTTGRSRSFDIMMPCLTEPYFVESAVSGPQADFACIPNAAKVRSQGFVRLMSTDPSANPIIDHGYFTDPEGADEQKMVYGVRLAREIAQQPGLRDWIDAEVLPGPEVTGYDDLASYVRSQSNSLYHPAGTCKMGAEDDPVAVVDPQLRVRGVDKLRVADTSVFPSMIGVNLCMTAMMIAEKCAALIKGEDAASQ